MTIPTYPIGINGQAIDNSRSNYPFLEYKNVTYFPLTWGYCNALNLKISWSNEAGLSITRIHSDSTPVINQELSSANKLGKSYHAYLPQFKITINGKIIDNNSQEYPLLNFRNITYFPLTWEYSINEFTL